MNNKQENRFGMYLVTADFCTIHAGITTPLPNFSETFASFKTCCGGIQDLVKVQQSYLNSSAAGKSALKKALVTPLADTARKLMAYAKLTKNVTLQNEINYTESNLNRLPDTTLTGAGQLIFDRAQTHLIPLPAYQVTAESQEALLEAVTQYRTALTAPRMDTAELARINKQLTDLFRAGDEALSDMDALVEILRVSKPDFYTAYKVARKVVNSGNTKLTVRGLVSDAQTGEPVPGVSAWFVPDGDLMRAEATGDETAVLVKKTAAKGRFKVQSLAPGTYRVRLKKVGYTDQVVTIYVNEGELTVMDVKLLKI